MGDVLTLIEQAEQVFDAEQAEAAAAKIGSGELTLEDFLEQMLAIRKMGPIGNLLGMLPGAGQMKDALAAVDDRQLDRVQAIIRGMTPAERADPKIINASRRLRIANGSGVTVSEVNQLVDRFFEARKMMSSMAGQMGMPFGAQGLQPQGRKRQGQEGQEGRRAVRRRRRCADPLGRRDAGHAGRVPRPVADAQGPRRTAAGAGRYRPVEAEVPRQEVSAATRLHVRGPRRCPTSEPVRVVDRRRRRSAPSRSAGAGHRLRRRLDPARPGRRALPRRSRSGTAPSTSTRRSGRPRPNATSARCCCATPDRRWTPAASTTATTCRASSARAGTWPARSATSRGLAIELEDESQLPDAVAEQARWGDGWVKLVGDWIDRDSRRSGAAVVRRRAEGGDRRRARQRRPGHRARLQRGRAARADQRRHRLHRARHRADRRHHRADGRARHRAGAHADQHRELPRHRRRGRASTRPTPSTCATCTTRCYPRVAAAREAGVPDLRRHRCGQHRSRTAASPTRSTRSRASG